MVTKYDIPEQNFLTYKLESSSSTTTTTSFLKEQCEFFEQMDASLPQLVKL